MFSILFVVVIITGKVLSELLKCPFRLFRYWSWIFCRRESGSRRQAGGEIFQVSLGETQLLQQLVHHSTRLMQNVECPTYWTIFPRITIQRTSSIKKQLLQHISRLIIIIIINLLRADVVFSSSSRKYGLFISHFGFNTFVIYVPYP